MNIAETPRAAENLIKKMKTLSFSSSFQGILLENWSGGGGTVGARQISLSRFDENTYQTLTGFFEKAMKIPWKESVNSEPSYES